MDTIGEALDWAPINDATLRASWTSALGLSEADPVRSLADVDHEDIDTARDGVRIGDSGRNPAARDRVVKSWRVARLVAGADKTRAELDKVDQEALIQ